MSPRHVDGVSRFFVELPVTDEAKCVRVQCVYCQQVKAKNTTRQKEHLRQCKNYLNAHPEAAAALQQQESDDASGEVSPNINQYGPTIPLAGPGGTTNVAFAPNPRINGTPIPLPPIPDMEGPARKKQKAVKQPKKSQAAGEDDISLEMVHAAFEEFQAKPDDKCMSARCRYCNVTRAKNTSRQRDHLRVCVEYNKSVKDKMGAPNTTQQNGNNAAVAQMQTQPAPTLEYDFRLVLRFSTPLPVGAIVGGHESWATCVGGSWMGRHGKGTLVPGGEALAVHLPPATQTTRISGRYLISTDESPAARILCKVNGWKKGDLNQRVTIEMETGDERHAALNTGLWVGTGSQRVHEVVFDAYRVG